MKRATHNPAIQSGKKKKMRKSSREENEQNFYISIGNLPNSLWYRTYLHSTTSVIWNALRLNCFIHLYANITNIKAYLSVLSQPQPRSQPRHLHLWRKCRNEWEKQQKRVSIAVLPTATSSGWSGQADCKAIGSGNQNCLFVCVHSVAVLQLRAYIGRRHHSAPWYRMVL